MEIKSLAHNINKKARTSDVLLTESIDFSSLMLSSDVSIGLKNAGFERPSPIQLKAIPIGRCGLDLIVQAKSGTGKTIVFTVVALEGLILSSLCVQVLVLAPTREIALQISEVIKTAGSAMSQLEVKTFIGGRSVKEDIENINKCHIAVGTPGRIKQLINDEALPVNSIRLFVLDEADKLLEMNFQSDINWIYSSLPDSKQMIALSATYPDILAEHLTKYMRNPTFVRLNSEDPSLLGIRQYAMEVEYHPLQQKVFDTKVEALVKILSQISFNQCLVFSNFQLQAQSLNDVLKVRGWPTTFISGNQDQEDRIAAIDQLKELKCRILVTTDLTSRGIDAEHVNLIVNFDVPNDHDTYLHRIGRAGRFGSYGAAISLMSGDKEGDLIQSYRQKCNTTIAPLPDPIPEDLAKSSGYIYLEELFTTEQLVTRSIKDENCTSTDIDADSSDVSVAKSYICGICYSKSDLMSIKSEVMSSQYLPESILKNVVIAEINDMVASKNTKSSKPNEFRYANKSSFNTEKKSSPFKNEEPSSTSERTNKVYNTEQSKEDSIKMDNDCNIHAKQSLVGKCNYSSKTDDDRCISKVILLKDEIQCKSAFSDKSHFVDENIKMNFAHENKENVSLKIKTAEPNFCEDVIEHTVGNCAKTYVCKDNDSVIEPSVNEPLNSEHKSVYAFPKFIFGSEAKSNKLETLKDITDDWNTFSKIPCNVSAICAYDNLDVKPEIIPSLHSHSVKLLSSIMKNSVDKGTNTTSFLIDNSSQTTSHSSKLICKEAEDNFMFKIQNINDKLDNFIEQYEDSDEMISDGTQDSEERLNLSGNDDNASSPKYVNKHKSPLVDQFESLKLEERENKSMKKMDKISDMKNKHCKKNMKEIEKQIDSPLPENKFDNLSHKESFRNLKKKSHKTSHNCYLSTCLCSSHVNRSHSSSGISSCEFFVDKNIKSRNYSSKTKSRVSCHKCYSEEEKKRTQNSCYYSCPQSFHDTVPTCYSSSPMYGNFTRDRTKSCYCSCGHLLENSIYLPPFSNNMQDLFFRHENYIRRMAEYWSNRQMSFIDY